MSALIDKFKAARRASAPLIAITTPDYPATERNICACMNGVHKIRWDIIRGYGALNDEGREAMEKIGLDSENVVARTGNPAEALSLALELPEDSVLFFHNAQRYLQNEAVCQAILNLRDPFKNPRRTLVMLAVDISLPSELSQDVLVLDEPLPDRERLKAIALDCYKSINTELDNKKMPKLPDPDKDALELIADSLVGLSEFPSEQIVSMSLSKSGMDTPSLWERKYKTIEQTPGLKVNRSKETFEDISGMDQIKKRMQRVFKGLKRWRCIFWMDEVEKMLAGATGAIGDSSGTSQYGLGKILTEMQENQWDGIIGVGPGGSGKSLLAKALGNTFEIPTFIFDIGATQASLVGQSQANINAAMKVAKAMAGDGVFWVATCNKIESLPPELKRRFSKGIYYFDIPDDEEKSLLWKMYIKKYNLPEQKIPSDEGWTAANVASCCRSAWEEQCSLLEAGESIIPITKSDPEGLAKLRTMANGRFLSVNRPGAYSMAKTEKKSNRKIEV
jgi:hypothetical protein